MLSNVNPANAVHNNSPAQQNLNATQGNSSMSSGTSNGMSFTEMLSNEIQAAIPPAASSSTIAATSSAAHAQAAQSANANKSQQNQSTSATAATNTANNSDKPTQTGTASGTTGKSGAGNTQTGSANSTSGVGQHAAGNSVGGKKPTKLAQTTVTTQADSASAAAATAATSAALASVAAGNPAMANASSSTDGAPNNSQSTQQSNAAAVAVTTQAADQAATSATADQFAAAASQAAALAAGASGAAGTASTHANETNAKPTVTGATNNVNLAASTKTPIAPVAAQTTMAVAPAQAASNQGKNVAPQSGSFEQTLNKAGNQEPLTNIKSVAPTSIEGNQAAATTPTTTTANQPSSNEAANALLLNAIGGTNGSMQTVRTDNQNLSAAQLSAIAPVLSMPTNAAPDVTPTQTVAPPVGSQGWDEAIGQKITWMATGGQQTASLTLNPPNLGPLQVTLSLNNQHANATFTSHQPEVRAALENAIPKLREILGQSGIQLGDCNVNSQPKQEFAQNQSNSNGNSSVAPQTNSSMSALTSTLGATQRGGVGLVDTFV